MKHRKVDPREEHYVELWRIVREAKNNLIAKTEAVIRKKGVIDLYPEGADKNIAIKDCETAQYNLICAIGHYDARVQELQEYYSKNSEYLSNYSSKSCTSHEIIEIVYANFFKK